MKVGKLKALGRPKKTTTGGERKLKTFGPRLREFREKRGLSQHELALAVAAHWTQISRYERGLQLPAADRIVDLARVLRVNPDALLIGDRGGVEEIEFKNIRLYERFRALDELPKDEQETVLRLVDAVLAKHKLEHLAEQVKRSA